MTGTWYPPTAGTGGFILSNPPFSSMTTTPNDTPETLHTVALRMVDTLDSLGILPEITDTLRRAIREPMVPPAPTDDELVADRLNGGSTDA